MTNTSTGLILKLKGLLQQFILFIQQSGALEIKKNKYQQIIQ